MRPGERTIRRTTTTSGVRLADERTRWLPAYSEDFEAGDRVTVLVDRDDPERMGIQGQSYSFLPAWARETCCLAPTAVL
jgi:hypothetical protein